MADPQELQESQIVPGEPDRADAGMSAETRPHTESPGKVSARRSMVKEVENTTADLDQRIVALTEQVAELSRRIEALEASRDQAQADGGADHNGAQADLAGRMRQLDERLQKLANILTQQTWGMGRS
jgi:phage shock protein A